MKASESPKWNRALFQSIDISSIVYFRIAFSAAMVWQVWHYFVHGRITDKFVEREFQFPYMGFEWVQPLPGDGMYWVFGGLGLLALMIGLGLFYRVATTLFCIGFTYIFLIDQTDYLNHFYFICLVSFLMIFVPANRSLSLDAKLKPEIRSQTAPAWSLWILRFQLAIVYFFGGVAKINGDWLRGFPLNDWLLGNQHFPVIGQYFDTDWMPVMMSWSGMLLDLFIVPFLLWKRTRIAAFVVITLFHLMNAKLFSIGVFPWLSIAMTALFFDPSWPRRFAKLWNLEASETPVSGAMPGNLGKPQRCALVLLIAYASVQIALPLRHWVYPGNVSWTEEGHYFAWRMKLRAKKGRAKFLVFSDQLKGAEYVLPEKYLTTRQTIRMGARPDMVLYFAHFLRDKYEAEGHTNVSVRARVFQQLNSRPLARLIDETVDLASVERSPLPRKWIVPLDQPLPGS